MEQALYRPVKKHLEKLGYTIKGEIGGCDLVGLVEGETPAVMIGELKLSFNLELVLQAVDRAAAGDEIWLAAKISKRGKGRENDARFRNLCRRLGFGMLGVDARNQVHVLVAPTAPPPRRDSKRRSRLIDEHRRRKGDPVEGGGKGVPILTAYRQDALLCAAALVLGPRRPKDLKSQTPRAASILYTDVYGWFERVERGVYGLTPQGREALVRWPAPSTA